MVMEAGKSKVCRVGEQAGDPEKSRFNSSNLKAVHCRIHSCSEGSQCFVPFRPSIDWMKPTHIMEINLLHSKSTKLSDNPFQNIPHRNIWNNVQPLIWSSCCSHADL